MIDLGHWFKESYKVPSAEVVNEIEETDEEASREENTEESEENNCH
jgi:endogenous inhibitor of DNA gyrase (YacG/DUF329 family)